LYGVTSATSLLEIPIAADALAWHPNPCREF